MNIDANAVMRNLTQKIATITLDHAIAEASIEVLGKQLAEAQGRIAQLEQDAGGNTADNADYIEGEAVDGSPVKPDGK